MDEAKNKARSKKSLLRTSSQSCLSGDLDIIPDYHAWPDIGFEPGPYRGARLLAVALEGQFDSFFRGKDSLLAKPAKTKRAC
jgi:ABC-2 type transport system permease protein